MADYKLDAAKEALTLIKPGQVIGLGAGSSIAHLVTLLSTACSFAGTLTFASSSFKTRILLKAAGLALIPGSRISHLDIYFDGCDQFDEELNVLKSGGGIHTSEKILASMATDFILIGDSAKSVTRLDTTYPLVIEVLPLALDHIIHWLGMHYSSSTVTIRMSSNKEGAVITEDGNYLLDVFFAFSADLNELNSIKMVPGVVEHSLFYRLATKAIIAGPEGITVILPRYNDL